MFVAKKKRKENVIEFIIYMLQIQDVIRALGLDKESVELKVISGYKVSSEEIDEVKAWYFGIIDQLINENKQEKGIIQSVLNILNEVNELHLWLMDSSDYISYKKLFDKIRPFLIEYQVKTKGDSSNDIELAIKLAYSYVLLKMKGEIISDETQYTVKEVSTFLNKLARFFVDYENGNMQVV